MTDQVQIHQTSTSLAKPVPVELYAGTDMTLVVQVACPSKCDLKGSRVRIAADANVVLQESELVSSNGGAIATAEFHVKAPNEPGEYTWAAMFAAQEQDGILHEQSSVSFSFVVKPHIVNMAVWDVPSPVVLGSTFRIKVGVKCSAECKLAGQEVTIHDQKGMQVATGTVGDTRWSDTSALYWADVELTAQGVEGLQAFEARSPKTELGITHESGACTFSFITAGPPEHMVIIEVVAQDTKAPIPQADVILHPYPGRTDEQGVAQLKVPKGEYALYVAAYGRVTLSSAVHVHEDVRLKAELELAPVEDTTG